MSFTISASDGAPTEAREAVRSILSNDRTASDVLLATSELVSNAVQHGELSEGEPITVDVRLIADRVRVSVSHHGPPFSRPPRPQRHRAGGFGFHILGQLAQRWDVVHEGGTTETWFEI